MKLDNTPPKKEGPPPLDVYDTFPKETDVTYLRFAGFLTVHLQWPMVDEIFLDLKLRKMTGPHAKTSGNL